MHDGDGDKNVYICADMALGSLFQRELEARAESVERIRRAAHEAHQAVGQLYGGKFSYGYHLDGVAHWVMVYGGEVCAEVGDVLPMMFGAWFHDVIEDARLSYHDVLMRAHGLGLDERQATLGAEIVYALTNEKGRTREERACARYYEGIRRTPYAPLVKLADRVANVCFSASQEAEGRRMFEVYGGELDVFLKSLRSVNGDARLRLPEGLVGVLYSFFAKKFG